MNVYHFYCNCSSASFVTLRGKAYIRKLVQNYRDVTFMYALQYYLFYEISYVLPVEVPLQGYLQGYRGQDPETWIPALSLLKDLDAVHSVTEDCRNSAWPGAQTLWLFSALSKVIQISDESKDALSEKVILALSHSIKYLKLSKMNLGEHESLCDLE